MGATPMEPIAGRPGDMRRDNDILQIAQRRISGQRFYFENIQANSNPAFRGDLLQGFFVNQ